MSWSPAANGHTIPEFRWLIDHAGWEAAPVVPGEDVQGPDVRTRIARDGVVFSAYIIPRGSPPQLFRQVELDPLPQWAAFVVTACSLAAEELCDELSLEEGEQESFRLLNAHFEEVKAYLRSDDFARATLRRQMALVGPSYSSTRDVLRSWRNETGRLRMTRGLVQTYLAERRQLSRYRRALESLERSES